ncbi:stage V sporulation protein AB [Thermoactinomyces sp. DSM 45891]|uniref:stage V sporulation protein AB n=1 Tax=Thermoactinomyces sp. DSM 45891 TaxID=1761907 RepID=UPI000916B368|nr:stage V sporulation protein AB [Thermoactinomyces sp. DSM 45891]SFX02741.1 stage V sporulation protein AB [Thermoactinomyces sp. DSM 45891]
MIQHFLDSLILVFFGLAGGFAVGSGFVAFIAVLDIVPRLTHLTRSKSSIHWYEGAIITGTLVFTWLDLRNMTLGIPMWIILPLGVFMGIFVGMLAAALTEALNVFPILVKRMGMKESLLMFLMAMSLGKVIGSLLQWTYFKIW